MKIAMIGAGYVGLVTGACFANFGHDVTCIDSDANRVATLNRGEIPIYEPGLEALIRKGEAAGRLSFTGNLAEGVASAAAVFIAVGTPSRRGDGHADLSYIYAAARDIAPLISSYTVIVDKSTVPVGTGDEVERIIREANPEAEFAVVSNPEFLREGWAIEDFTRPDRIVIGAPDERSRAVMAEIYAPLTDAGAPVIFASRRSAELIKYAANAFLAMKVSFINEVADLADAVGANVLDVARGIGADARIGARYLNAGAGYGGSCLPKDTAALIRTAEENGRSLQLIEATRMVNAGRREAMIRKIADAVGDDLHGKRIGILGLSFAPNTDDLRDAPALGIIEDLLARGASVAAHDPAAMPAARALLPKVDFAAAPYVLAQDADALVLITEWKDYKSLDLARLGAVMRNRVFVDLRNGLRGADFAPHGFRYRSVGRPDEDIR